MVKVVIVLTTQNEMGSFDIATNQAWVEKIGAETRRFYDVPLDTNSPVLIGAKTFLKANTNQRFGQIFQSYRKIFVITTHSLHELKLQNSELGTIKNLQISSDLHSILKKYFKNRHEDLVILGGLKIYDQVIDYIDQLLVIRTKVTIPNSSRKFLINFKNWQMINLKIQSNFQEETWIRNSGHNVKK